MKELIDLELIDPNPYQPREKEDAMHVKNVALSIAERGLMQVPMGRLVMNGELMGLPGDIRAELDDGCRIQLAFGHTRLAAYKWLRDVGPHSNIERDFSRMPVELRELSDIEMFEYSIQENLARKDLTPLEEARAMKRYREEFGKTSAEIGSLFGLSDSAVRNKMRLLNLPEDVQVQAAEKDLPEGVIRGLVTLFDLPESLRKSANGKRGWIEGDYVSFTPESLTRGALAGEINADELQSKIKRLLDANSIDLNQAEWPMSWVREDPRFEATSCKDCPIRIKERNRCTALECFKAKKQVWRGDYLYKASHASGIVAQEAEAEHIHFWTHPGFRDNVKRFVDAGCENLRLQYDSNPQDYEKDIHLGEQGFPNAEVVCIKKGGHCVCVNGFRALRDNGGLPQEAVSTDDLQAAAKAERVRIRESRKMAKGLKEAAAEIIFQAIAEGHPGAWHWMASQISWNIAEQGAELEQIQRRIANHLAGDPEHYSGDAYQHHIKHRFLEHNLPLPGEYPENVSAETFPVL